MTRRRWLTTPLAVAVTASWSCGPRTYPGDDGGWTVEHQFFGRVLRADVFDRNGIEERRVFATWSEPMPCMAVTECASIHVAEWYDDDADGRWDRWMRKVGPTDADRCFIEYRVDTDGDGASDWTFLASQDDYESTAAAIQARRGH